MTTTRKKDECKLRPIHFCSGFWTYCPPVIPVTPSTITASLLLRTAGGLYEMANEYMKCASRVEPTLPTDEVFDNEVDVPSLRKP